MDVINLSQQLLLAVKKRAVTNELRRKVATLSLTDLKAVLATDNEKKAFWINLYNAYYQILRREIEMIYPAIFREAALPVAGAHFSLDDLEHGILRRFQYKHQPEDRERLFQPDLVKLLMVEQLDYRIHFALNCGAKSCPPIAFYQPEHLDLQLDLATQSFLESESIFDEENQVHHTTALFEWFAKDFGGEKGIRDIYRSQLGQNINGWEIRYQAYSWEENLSNFVE